MADSTVHSRKEILSATGRIRIESPRLSGSISLTGARVDDLILRNYQETIEEDSANITLLNPSGMPQSYFAEFGWWTGKEVEGPDRSTVWTASSSVLSPDNPVILSWTNGSGVTFEQHYTLDANYMFTVTQRVVNRSGRKVQVAPYGMIARTGTPEVLGFYILHEGLIGVLEDNLKEVDYDELQDGKPVRTDTVGGWLGITDKYWLAALIPDQNTSVQAGFSAIPRGGDYIYKTDFLSPVSSVSAGTYAETTNRLFAGAKETLLLDAYGKDLGINKFDLAVDFGWFYFLTKPIFYAIHWLYGLLGNFGLAILALTVLIKLAVFPLANKSYVSMSKMKLLAPQIKQLQERFKDDKQKLSQEMMGLYKKEKVNPVSGCLPIAVQIPIFFSLYKVLFVTIEMRHAPFFGWIQDLSARDPLGLLTVFGLVDWNVPASLDILNIGIWPIIMGLTMWFQQKLNPAPADPVQAKVFAFLPFVFTFMLGAFPAGLVIYWAWNNLLSMAQQWVIMKRMGVSIGGGKAE